MEELTAFDFSASDLSEADPNVACWVVVAVVDRSLLGLAGGSGLAE